MSLSRLSSHITRPRLSELSSRPQCSTTDKYIAERHMSLPYPLHACSEMETGSQSVVVGVTLPRSTCIHAFMPPHTGQSPSSPICVCTRSPSPYSQMESRLLAKLPRTGGPAFRQPVPPVWTSSLVQRLVTSLTRELKPSKPCSI